MPSLEPVAVEMVSIPLKSGRCCKVNSKPSNNLFFCLNPFEVREVLQGISSVVSTVISVSIPLKSGRCCKQCAGHPAKQYWSQSL